MNASEVQLLLHAESQEEEEQLTRVTVPTLKSLLPADLVLRDMERAIGNAYGVVNLGHSHIQRRSSAGVWENVSLLGTLLAQVFGDAGEVHVRVAGDKTPRPLDSAPESLNTPKPVPSTVTTISETSLKKKYSALKESIVGALKQYCLEQGYREYTNEEGGVTKLFLTKAEYVKLGVIRALKKNVLEKAYNKVTSGARKRKTVVLMDMSYDEFLKLYTPLIYKYK
ncbi:hypothetical protein CYMTET_56145 [Cymbomonas tetramitiformis]|uniref:Uncharacterized protein n=1 Tax=Cymbomonas tetramitiformis TaxID=36881 RepID=A0AAE0BD99_9CHLO|nr:hypothetical protein CYMTET_56145 [Cymbomonas tetramitiformis]